MSNAKMMSTKEYTLLCIENFNNSQEDTLLTKSRDTIIESVNKEANEYIIKEQYRSGQSTMMLMNFNTEVKKVLLAECIGQLFNGSLKFIQETTDRSAVGRNLINKFIDENSVDGLLRTFRTKNILLSEYHRIVTKHHKAIMEAVDKSNPDSFNIDTTMKDNFFDDLNMIKPDDVIMNIRTRVTDAVQDFIDGNIADKLDIKEIIQKVQDKVDAAKTNEVKESYSILGKNAINQLKQKPKNVFGAIVNHMAESVLKTDALKPHFMTEGKLNIDKIVESCKLMYTLLETVNSADIITVNEKYIKTVLDGLKA